MLGAGATMVAGGKAAKAQKNAAAQQVAEQRRQYDLTRSDLAPWRAAGTQALGSLGRAYAGDYSDFHQSPNYAWTMQQGLQGIDRNRASRGLLNSGAADKARMGFAQGLASGEYGNWFNQGLGLAGLGQNATNTTAQVGMNTSNNISNAYQQAGNARASSYANTGSAINSGINNVLSAYLFQNGGGFGGGGNRTPDIYNTPPFYPGPR